MKPIPRFYDPKEYWDLSAQTTYAQAERLFDSLRMPRGFVLSQSPREYSCLEVAQ